MKTEISWRRRLFRKKLKYMLLCVVVVGIVFVIHQLFYYKELNQEVIENVNTGSVKNFHYIPPGRKRINWNDPEHSKLIRDTNGRIISLRGSKDQDIKKYLPNARGKFMCFASKEEIDFIKINDDYCDCPLDGSDEPGTNACNNGFFNCEVPSLKFKSKIPSYKVNDGVCDCCDGSDEWAGTLLLFVHTYVKNTSHQKVSCPNKC